MSDNLEENIYSNLTISLHMSPSSQDTIYSSNAPPTKRSKMTQLASDSGDGAGLPQSDNRTTLSNVSGQQSQQTASNRKDSTFVGEGINDQNSYSRQLYALGESAMTHLRKSNVLISGIGSVGVEVAKNLILGGVRHVTIHDTKATQSRDLSIQLYLSEADLGQNRAAASFNKLEKLNDSVQCSLHVEPLTEEFVKKFDLVVLTDASHSVQLEVNAWTRLHGNRFISADARGLFAYLFVDLGEKFHIDDPNGEQCKEVLIEHVNGETGDVFTLEGAFHGFEDGDYVAFSEINGMTELNSLPSIKIKVLKPNLFNIGDVARNFPQHTGGGRARQVKVPQFIGFKSLADAMKEPEMTIWDFAKFDEPSNLHALWQALFKFEDKYKRSPNVRSVEDAKLLEAELPDGTEKISEKLLRNFSFQATGNLQPIASLIGCITAQEAMKAVTHHTTPLKQFLYIACLDSLPGDCSSLCATADDCKPDEDPILILDYNHEVLRMYNMHLTDIQLKELLKASLVEFGAEFISYTAYRFSTLNLLYEVKRRLQGRHPSFFIIKTTKSLLVTT